jgi:hypothetical protein
MLVRRFCCDRRRGVARCNACGEAALRDEVLLELLGVDVGLTAAAEQPGELAVEIDELLGGRLPLLRVGVQKLGLGRSPKD